MERRTNLEDAKKIMGQNYIGPEELKNIQKKVGVKLPYNIMDNVPSIQFSKDKLLGCKDEYILILGVPFYKDGTNLTLNKMREHLGCDPLEHEPCFYNQDWYVNEAFANSTILLLDWYLLRKEIVDNSRGKFPEINNGSINNTQCLPSALLLSYIFFCYYFHSDGLCLWKNDYIWCSDVDINGDRIYVGRYYDPKGINKNGFSIHRFLSINKQYGTLE
jgi:hypothetical protein